MTRGRYEPNPHHAGGYIAKFRKQVHIHPDGKPRAIYRGGQEVGTWPGPAYSVQIRGVLSTSAANLAAAMALGEFYGNENQAPGRRRHAMSHADAVAYVQAQEADSAALMARYPFTPEERASLAAGIHADILEPISTAEFERRVAQLSGGVRS